MKSYFAIFRMRQKMEWQYRGAALGGILCQVFFGLILVALYRALYAGKPQSMPLSSVVTYVWLQQAFFRMLLSEDDELLDKIRTGDVAYDMCRPLSLYGYYYARIMAQKLVGSVMRAVPMLIFAFLLPQGWRMEAPVTLPALGAALCSVVMGLFCVCALCNITMALTMVTLDASGVRAALNLLMMTLSGNLLPLTLFPDSWQRVISFLPYSQVLDAPIRLYTGEWALAQAPRALGIQCAWIVILIILGLWLWRKNQKRLIVQGG